MLKRRTVSDIDLTRASGPPVPHPLALELARFLANRTLPVRALVLGAGSGRNFPALLATGATVAAIEDDPERFRLAVARFGKLGVRSIIASYAGPYPYRHRFTGALSTHALLHGRPSTIIAAVAAVEASLVRGGCFFTTLGSTSDPRYGTGRRIDDNTFAAASGAEAGVPHVYFDEAAVRTLFAAFEIDDIAERSASETAGRWAHSESEAETLVHWFVRVRIPES